MSKSKTAAADLSVHPVAGRIGAEIRGVRVSRDLDKEQLEGIRQALREYKVIFLRDQHLEDADQEAFAKALGKPVAHPTVPVKSGSSYLLEIDSANGGRANSWHTDVTFVDAYPSVSILRAVVIPEAGGDTQWANTVAAYRDLAPELRDLADRLWAVHSNEYDYAARRPNAKETETARFRDVFTSTLYETEHPVVRVHPETGERSLLLGHFVKRFVGLSTTDSQHLFALLQSHVIAPENTVRWRWRAGDVAIWDNRATQHYAINDYGDQHRVVRRVTLEGDVPIGIDGRRSITRKKEVRAPQPIRQSEPAAVAAA